MTGLSAKKMLYFVLLVLFCLAAGYGPVVLAQDEQASAEKSPVQVAGPTVDDPGEPATPAPVPDGAEGAPVADDAPVYTPGDRKLDQGRISAPPSPKADVDGDIDGMTIEKNRISLDLKGIDINELLRIMSMKMGVTIVPSRSVNGRVNIFLNNLTLQDAFDIILSSQDLAADRRGDIISVMTQQEYEKLYGKKYNDTRKFKTIKLRYAKPSTVFTALGQLKSDIGKIIVDESSATIFLIDVPEKLELMEKTIKDLDQPLQTQIFDIKYAKSADMKAHISTAITAGSGEMYMDEKSSKLVVSDLPGKMRKIERMVEAFDSAPLQVFIEAEIIDITLNNQFQRGVNWEKLFGEFNKKKLGLTNKRAGIAPQVLDIAASFLPGGTVTSTAFQKITFGTMATDDYTVVLNYLQTYGETKILSSPRIAVVNNQEAKILVGRREAYISQTLSQAQTTTVTSESVQFVDVGVKLNVVPTINNDGFVIMKIKPEVSSVAETITTGLGSRIPIVATAEAETVIKVKDGTMIMIAGLVKDQDMDKITGMPGLSKIPIIGAAFGNKDYQKQRSEIIVFITPHIITGEVAIDGARPEGYLPPQMISPHTKDHMVETNVNKIDIKPLPDEGQIGLKEMPVPQSKMRSDINVQDRMKGLKGL